MSENPAHLSDAELIRSLKSLVGMSVGDWSRS